MPGKRMRSAVSALSFCFVAGLARSAGAVDRFEIQVYDGSSNAPGAVSLENHVNFVDRGHDRAEPPEAPSEHQAHWTFEGALGVTRAWEAGVYLQTAYVPGAGLDYAGVKLRSKLMIPEGVLPGLRLGANFELSNVEPRFESERWALELRPILALTLPRLLLAVNPILELPLSGSGPGSGPALEPAVSAKGRLSSRVALGVEYYAGLGPLGAAAPARDQYLYGAADYDLGRGFALNLGVGAGLTEASDPLTLKGIFAYELGRLW